MHPKISKIITDESIILLRTRVVLIYLSLSYKIDNVFKFSRTNLPESEILKLFLVYRLSTLVSMLSHQSQSHTGKRARERATVLTYSLFISHNIYEITLYYETNGNSYSRDSFDYSNNRGLFHEKPKTIVTNLPRSD